MFAGALLLTTACQPEAPIPCASKQGYVGWMAIDDGGKDEQRFIASLAAFAKANRMEFETNRYENGVPGNPRPHQFIASACSAHLYVLASNISDPGLENEPSRIAIQIFDDAPLADDRTPPLAYKLKAQLEAEFKLAGRGLYDG